MIEATAVAFTSCTRKPTVGGIEADLLDRCLSGLERTPRANLEIIVVDNGSREEATQELLERKGPKVVRVEEPFNFSRLINLGAQAATGEYLLILNNDTETANPEWLDAMLEQARRPGVGVVGARLLYPWLAPQHEGIMLVCVDGEIRGAHLAWRGYHALDRAVRDVEAVTAACLMTPRSVFEELGGLDESLRVAFGDVDYCLRAARQGYRVLYTPFAEVLHFEGATRGSFYPRADEAAFNERWRGLVDRFHPAVLDRFLDVRVHRPEEAARPDIGAVAFGVNLAGFLTSEKGIGEAARRVVSALDAASIARSLEMYEDPASAGVERIDRRGEHGHVHPVNVTCINPDFLPTFLHDRGPSYLRGRYNIALWNWELEDVPAEWVKAAAMFDEVWVPSRFIAEPLSRALSVPVIRIPYPVDPDPPRAAELTRDRLRIPHSAFLFLFLMDFHSVAERKNPLALIRAFRAAFVPGDDAWLLIKTARSHTDRKTFEAIRAAAQGANVRIVDEVLRREEVNGLYALGDSCVSLHRSEGYGLTLLEAMTAAKPVIATGYGGNMDFMNDKNSVPVSYRLVELDKDYPPYRRGWRWAEPDVDHGASAMRRLYEDRDAARRLGQAARESALATLHPRTVGAALKQRLDTIRWRLSERNSR